MWVGSGLAHLEGLDAGDPVTEAQMRNLFGSGRAPLAQQLRAAPAPKPLPLALVADLLAGPDTPWHRLHGLGEGAEDGLAARSPPPRPVRVYAAVGTHRDLLACLVRRLLENGANSSFVHQFSDPDVSAEQLAVDPRSVASAASSMIASGLGLFDPARRNSRGYDLGAVSYPHLLAHDTVLYLVCLLLLD